MTSSLIFITICWNLKSWMVLLLWIMMISLCNSIIIIINKLEWTLARKDSPDASCVKKSNHEIRWHILKPKWPLYPQRATHSNHDQCMHILFNANTTNFRALVQLFTGCPTTVITCNFWQQLIPKQHLMQDQCQSQVIFFQLAWRSWLWFADQ